MLLKTLALENFKAFGRKQEITFAEPSPRSLGLTVILGPNNGGKTTILKTIRQLVSSEEAFVAGAEDRRKYPVNLELRGSADVHINFAITVEAEDRRHVQRNRERGRLP
jgi:predicted ATP-binding protein involved in virulence